MVGQAGSQESMSTAGQHRVMAAFEDLQWGPTPNPFHDLGVDLIIQVRDRRRFDRNMIVMAQVKSGNKTYFDPDRELRDESGVLCGWWYPEPDATHFEDWVQHGLPHLVVLHHPDTKITYWVHVTKEAVKPTGKGFKILVPESQQVNEANLDALLAVAASAKTNPQLQGTSYTASAQAAAPGRALRYAMLAPRLIAPHPNASSDYDRRLTPEEAIALIAVGRLFDLEHFARSGSNPKLNQAGPASKDWRWRLFAAVREFATDRRPDSLVSLAGSTAKPASGVKMEQPSRIAAAVAAATVALVGTERWQDAVDLLDKVVIDLPPVDYSWLLIHRALVLVELGKVEEARQLAAEASRQVNLDLDDVTAAAIGAAAAELLLSTSFRSGQPPQIGDAVTAGDAATSWWRSMVQSAALAKHDAAAFDAWAYGDDVDRLRADNAQDRLSSVWFSGSLAGARGAAAHALTVWSQHELVHGEIAWREHYVNARFQLGATAPVAPDPQISGIELALDAMRRCGAVKQLEKAARRLWENGPVEALQRAAVRAVNAPWAATNARGKLELLIRGGDLLPSAAADAAVKQCLAVLADPIAFENSVRPHFAVAYFCHRALAGTVRAAEPSTQEQVVVYVLQNVPQDRDDPTAEDLVEIIDAVPADVAAAHADELLAKAHDTPHSRLSAALLAAALPTRRSMAETALNARADAGDRHAISALGSADSLSLPTAASIIQRETDACADVLSSPGSFGGWDSVRALTVLNLAFPDAAKWDPVLEVLRDPRVLGDQKTPTIEIIAARADELPSVIATALQAALRANPQALDSMAHLHSWTRHTAAVFGLRVALGVATPAEALGGVHAWLRGAAEQRASAGRLLQAIGARSSADPTLHGALAILTTDPQPQVRAEATSALLRNTTLPLSPIVEHAITAAVSEPGCLVPLTVAHRLHALDHLGDRREPLRALLSKHTSADVRYAARPTP
jgi:hypothetical protein